jgi:hypothetical protein
MFPLSTPTTTGLWVDWLSLAIVLAGLCAFVLGLSDLWRRGTQRHALVLAPVTLGAYGALGLVGLSVAVMLAGGRGIPVAQAAFLAVAAWGLAIAVMRAPRVWHWWKSASGADLGRTAAFAAAACYSIWFWTDVFQDHVALPGAYDGIVHTAYYLRILEAGVPTLGRVSIGFANIFGTQMFEFYPTGTHALMAIASGFWGQWGLVSHAGILKAWFTLTLAAMPWALFWVARRLMPRMPWWVGLALVFVAMPGFRFPIEAAHEGGASRLLAHVFMAPIYADVLLGRFGALRRRPLAGIVLGLAFLMHPSAFVTLAALLAYAAMCTAAGDAGWRARVLRMAGLAAALAIGALIAAGLLEWNGGVALARDPAKPFSWTTLAYRLQAGWTTLSYAEYGVGRVKQCLIGLGLVLLVTRRKALGLPWRVVGLPIWMVLVAVAALSAQVVSLPGSRLIGGAFYDETPRVIEVLYESVGMCLAAVAWCVWILAAGRALDSHSPGRYAKTASAVGAGLVVAALVYQQARGAWVHDHLRYWDRQLQTPRISRLHALGAWIENNTERNAILFHPPFDSEIWEAWTGRRGIFMYGECHVHNHQLPCNRRKDLINARIDVLRGALDRPASAVGCLAEIDPFGRPGYFLVPSSVASTQPFPVCGDATYVTTLDGHAVVAYRRP